MIDIEKILDGTIKIEPVNEELYKEIKANWDSVAKPLDSMGVFETFLSRIGAIQGEIHLKLAKSRIIVMCADNGIVEEGVSQSDQSITALCAENIAAYKSCLGIMAKREGTEILAVDMGMNTERKIPNVINKKVRMGSRNFHKEPAMTKEEVLMSMQTGLELVGESKKEGFLLLGTGEMGIGNTTTSSAVAAALLKEKSEKVTGRGAGLNDAQLSHKKQIIAEAIDKYDLENKSPLEVLCTVGGYDIAALAGMCIGGAVYHVPIVLDGFISMVAALVACRLVPDVADFIIPSHSSKEPAVMKIREELSLMPVIDAKMALGEGTGAVLMISLLKTANEVYENSSSFENYGMEQYERF